MDSQFFPGSRQVGERRLIDLDPTHRVSCALTERWVSIKRESVGCGMSMDAEFTLTTGVDQAKTQKLDTKVVGKFGKKDVWELAGEIARSTSTEVKLTASATEKRTVKLEAPKCGVYGIEVFQRIRSYDLTFFSQQTHLFASDVWVRTGSTQFDEQTADYHILPWTEPYHADCKCPPSEAKHGFMGLIEAAVGNLSASVPYRLRKLNLDVLFGRKVVTFAADQGTALLLWRFGGTLKVPVDALSDEFTVLMGSVPVDDGMIDVRFGLTDLPLAVPTNVTSASSPLTRIASIDVPFETEER